MLAGDCLESHSCFAGLNALVPCVIEVGVTRASTAFEPGTAATTTTRFPRFDNVAAFIAHITDGHGRRHD